VLNGQIGTFDTILEFAKLQPFSELTKFFDDFFQKMLINIFCRIRKSEKIRYI